MPINPFSYSYDVGLTIFIVFILILLISHILYKHEEEMKELRNLLMMKEDIKIRKKETIKNKDENRTKTNRKLKVALKVKR